MKKIVARLMIAALPIVAAAACSDDTVTPPDPSTLQDTTKTPPVDIVKTVSIPEYAPMGDDVDLRKLGAAGIDDKNASAKASELEGAIDAQIKSFEAKKPGSKAG